MGVAYVGLCYGANVEQQMSQTATASAAGLMVKCVEVEKMGSIKLWKKKWLFVLMDGDFWKILTSQPGDIFPTFPQMLYRMLYFEALPEPRREKSSRHRGQTDRQKLGGKF